MGLDGVELVIAVEERFGIRIDDSEAAGVRTVGDLERLVRTKLEPPESQECLTSHAFYRLRSALIAQCGLPRHEIRPDSGLAGLVPEHDRRRLWHALQESLGWRLPPLRRPRAVEHAVILVPLYLVVAAVASGSFHVLAVPVALTMGVSGVLVGWLISVATRPLAIHFPANATSVGDATETLLAHNFARIAQERRSRADTDVWKALRSTIAETLAIDAKLVTREARFVEELGIG